MFHVPNKYRLRNKRGLNIDLASDDSYGNNGFFIIPHQFLNRYQIYCQASDGAIEENSEDKWEHVSISIAVKGEQQKRTPTWQEMCYIKSLFWDEEDCVIQYHPPRSEYINMHQFVLHLWKPVNKTIPIPPKIMVGI